MSTTSPDAVTGPHLPALNGLRALAVLAVIAYHLQLGWASGGYLGVDLFFVLSGFLITSLLLEEWAPSGTVDLVAFWGRRARRLLPALFLVVLALSVYLILNSVFGGANANGLVDLSGLRGDAIATLLYVGNWHSIYAHQSYFAQFSTPSPLQHTWSLAIEEQFYLVWPPLLLAIVRISGTRWRHVGLAVAVVLGVASAVLMALLFHPGSDPLRVYYGTDTRAFDLMAGIALAFATAARPQPGERTCRLLHLLAPVAAAGLAVVWVVGGTSEGLPTNWMFDGGFLGCAVLAVVVLADARLLTPGLFGRVLGTPPLHFLGTISYGMYLWHWPVIVYLTADRTGLSSAPLDIARVLVTLALSTASYYLVERPIRRSSFNGWRRWSAAPIAGLATAAIMVVATVPAVADPVTIATTAAGNLPTGLAVPGAGGYSGQVPITLADGTISRARPLRVVLIGDSVMRDASFGITAALGATHEVKVTSNAIDGFGLVQSSNWPSAIPLIIRQERPQLVIASWSWDQDGPTTPNALDQPAQYAAVLKRFVKVVLTPGDGVEGVIFTQFPPIGTIPNPDPAVQASYNRLRTRGTLAWNAVAAQMPSAFPGKVMYLPLADSILLSGRFSSWLPPFGRPGAPADQWTRVRKLDNVHLCPEGSARYANALLIDMTALFGLHPVRPGWSSGRWTANQDFNDPPGSCPADHPGR